MQTVAATDHYEIRVDKVKNRLNLTMKGSWTSTKAVPNWLDDMASALTLLSAGFTVLIDWTDVGAVLLTDYIASSHGLMTKAGVRKAARVFSVERFLNLQMDKVTEKTGFPVKWFRDVKEAEAWLEEY